MCGGAVCGERDELEAGDAPHVGSRSAILLRLPVPRRYSAAHASKATLVLDLVPIAERELP